MVEMDGYIRRGEMYWVGSEEHSGYEYGPKRPGVVVSSQYGNDNSYCVTVAYATLQNKPGGCNVATRCSGRLGFVLCGQIQTVDKRRLGEKLGELNEKELKELDEKLAKSLDLVLPEREVDNALEDRVASLEEELLAKRVEIATVEKLYEKALEMLAGNRQTNDLQRPPKKHAPRYVADEPEYDEEIENRRGDDGGKVNVNTADWKEIHEKLGIYEGLAHRITGYRKKHGPYGSLKDLLKVDRFTQYYLDTYGERLTV